MADLLRPCRTVVAVIEIRSTKSVGEEFAQARFRHAVLSRKRKTGTGIGRPRKARP